MLSFLSLSGSISQPSTTQIRSSLTRAALSVAVNNKATSSRFPPLSHPHLITSLCLFLARLVNRIRERRLVIFQMVNPISKTDVKSLVRSAKKALTSYSVSLDNYTPADCRIAFDVSSSPLIQTLRLIHLFCCLVGVICSSLFVFVLISKSSRNVHVNLRLSLISLSVAAWIACAQLLFTAFYGLAKTVSTGDQCDALSEAVNCAIVRFPVVLSIYATLCGIMVLAIERTISTLKYKTYEVKGSRAVAVGLISAQWVISISMAIMSTYLRTDPGFLHVCTVYISHPKTAVYSLGVMAVLEAFSLLFFVILLHSNQRRQISEFLNNSMHTLTERYQLQENVRIMKILIPSITVHTILTLLGMVSMLIFSLFHRSDEELTLVEFAPFSEAVLLVVPIHAVIFPLVAILRNKQLKQTTKRALPCLFNAEIQKEPVRQPMLAQDRGDMTVRTSRQLEQDSDTHFLMLNDMWKK